MVTKSFLVLGGSPIVAAALASAAFVGLAGTASAGIIYQDSFTGSGSTPLNGQTPTIDNGTSSAWYAWGSNNSGSDTTDWSANGVSSGSGNASVSLQFTPTAGNVYTLSAGLNPTISGGDFCLWYATSQAPYLFFSNNPGPWVGVNTTSGLALSGPGGAGQTPFNTTSGVQDIAIVLNTTTTLWTYQVYDNSSLVASSSTVPFSSNPIINDVGFTDYSNVTGSISNFSLTVQPVPEPASLGLLSVGAAGCLGLLLLRRRRLD